MIGIFDSGSGGLTFLAAMRRRFPAYSYVYCGDYDNCPYGDKTPPEIQYLTTQGVQKLFDAGASIVILACNTASAWTLRTLQNEIYSDKKILSVTIPGAEKVIALGLKTVTVFATAQTVKSRLYKERVHILDDNISVHEIALPGDLVRDIEQLLPVQRCRDFEHYLMLEKLYDDTGWNVGGSEILEKYFSLEYRSTNIAEQSLLLGCTHYSYLRKSLQQLFPSAQIIDPSEEASEKLGVYIERHGLTLQTGGEVRFL